MNKNIHYVLLVSILFALILNSCSPSGSLPENAVSTVTLIDPSQTPTINSTAVTPTTFPTAVSTPTPEMVRINLPVTQIAFERLIETNADGKLSSFFWEEYPDDGVFNAPESPTYLWNINPFTDYQIRNIIVSFDVFDTKGAQVTGFDRGALVELYNMNTILDGSPTDLKVISPMGVIRYPPFGEKMDRYYEIQTDADGVRHFTVSIPYEEFLGGKRKLAVQFLPGTVYSEPTAQVEGINLDQSDLIQQLSEEYNPESQDVTWLDQYWDNSCSLSYSADMEMPRCFDVDFFGSPCEILAAEYDLQETAKSEVVLYPGAVETTMDCQYSIDEEITLMRENMINPETGLVYGVWDYIAEPDEKLISTDQISSNILIASGYGYGNDWDMIEYQDPQSEFFLQEILIKAIDQEIVQVPNGKWIFAPGGINANGELIIKLDDLSIMVQEIYKELRQVDLERADHLLEGYANTLQLVLEAQELTPTNLVSDELIVKYSADGSYTFNYQGDFNMGNRFYYFWLRNYEFYSNDLQGQIVNEDLFNDGKLDFFLSMSPEDRDYQLRQFYYDTKRFDNVQRIPFYVYKLFYNIYTGSDRTYTRYYSISDRTPIYESHETEITPWKEFLDHYGSIQSLVTWVQLAAFFNDDQMLSETYPNLIKSMHIADQYLIHYDFSDIQNPRTWVVNQGLGKRDLAYFARIWNGAGMRLLRGANIAPWGMNGALDWRITFDERIEQIEQKYGIDFTSLIAQEP